MAIIKRVDHFTVTSSNLEASTAFYALFGLAPGNRPPFQFPGLWLYSGDRAILHVISTQQLPQETDGVIDHIAFWAEDLDAALTLLASNGISYELMRAPAPFGIWQLFFRDPFGAMVELNFAASEETPARYQETTRPHALLAVPARP